MSFWFGDSFDLYAAAADASPSYWDTGSGTGWSLVAGRFTGSRALQSTAGSQINVLKNSGQNDVVHHISVAYKQTAAITGTASQGYLILGDGATAQCTIIFRSDGAILINSGGTAGTLQATYTGAVIAQDVWYHFEFEVVINNTTGSFTARKNGNVSNDFQATAINTRAGANTYANRLTVGNAAGGSAPSVLDDLLWRSDASSVAWLGDIRCYTRMPANDQAVAWTPSNATLVPQTPQTAAATSAVSATSARHQPFIAAANGAIGSVIVNLGTGYTGNMKCTIFANSVTNTPGAILGSATPITNPAAGANTFTFSTPVAVTQGTQYWVGFMSDTASGTWSIAAGSSGGFQQTGTSYAAFPTANPSTGNVAPVIFTANLTPTSGINFALAADPQQDAANGYVSSATVGQSDLYGIAAIAATPANTIAVVTRGYLQKSDAGTRNTAIQLKSGASLVNSGSAALGTVWGWQYRVDQVDPATSAAWTATAVNNAQIGPIVTV